ncbi:MAG: glycosyltransferase family 1 protein [Candidatus Lokiarchaeota archaeon]|nr:glycosyltransferase family 1 protein [Candidatus Lokiarchaeota archaeon]
MKILFVGVFQNLWSSNIFLEKALKNNNHSVDHYNYRNNEWKLKKKRNYPNRLIYHVLTKISNYHYFPSKLRDLKFFFFGNKRINYLLFNKIEKKRYDLVLFAKIDTINYKLINHINKISKTWYFFMDPIDTAYNIRAYQYAKRCTWSSASTSAMNKLFLKFGANSYYILEGYDPTLFNPGNQEEEKIFDVIFVGSKSKIRENYINFLRENNVNIKCFGFGWENDPIYLKDLVSTYRTSKIILNFPRVDTGFSDRVFQAMGTSSLLLSKYCSDLKRVFKKAIHLDWFNSPEESLKLINFYLINEEKRKKIAEKGYNFVRNNYTWDHTAKKIIEIAQK